MLAAADRFMWDMSRIPRYEQRLNSLVFKRKVPGRILCSARLWSTPLRINFALSHSETEPVERSSVQSLNFASTLMTQFSERLAFVQPRIESVLNASTEITASKGLRCLLELVLALGTTPYTPNYHRTKEKPRIDRLRKLHESRATRQRTRLPPSESAEDWRHQVQPAQGVHAAALCRAYGRYSGDTPPPLSFPQTLPPLSVSLNEDHQSCFRHCH